MDKIKTTQGDIVGDDYFIKWIEVNIGQRSPQSSS